jgi:hypothetical protein
MKKLFTATILVALFASNFCIAQTQAPQAEKPRLVVFVVGMENDKVSDYLTSLIGNNLSRTYTIIPRTEAIKKKMQELKEYEDAGHIDDRQLIEWGRQHNVQTLCLVTAVQLEECMFSAQLTDVKTNTLIGNAEYEIPTLSSDDLKKAASALAGQLQKKKGK